MCKSRLFLCCILALSTFGLPAFAKGPSGQTPATEQVCDGLKAGDVTKGLYGLCVAFCEARDLAAESATIKSHEGRAATDWSSRRERFLADYNKKKRAADPDMPCLPVAAPAPQPSCPCWSAAEADAIDGVLSDGSTATGWSASSSASSACSKDPLTYIQETGTVNSQSEVALIEAIDSPQYPQHMCLYAIRANGTLFMFSLSLEGGNLTAEQLADCKTDVLARQAAMNLCQPIP